MKNNRIGILVVSITIVIVILSLIIPKSIPEDYLAVFRGDNSYSTYIYKIDNEHANMGFKYINTKGNKVMKTGEVTWTDDVFKVAKDHGAYSYVKIPGDSKKYSIEEFQNQFLMN
jgi:hypothetical protein